MKKILFLIAAVLMTAATASAVRYKGYGEIIGGGVFPPSHYSNGGSFGFATSHGVEIIDGLFVGAGIDGTVAISDGGNDGSWLIVGFAEARYNFLRKSRISPFVGTRLGGGWEGYGENGCFYFSPSVGCTFNLTKRFGLDVSLGYSLYNSTEEYYSRYGSYNEAVNIHGLSVRFGVHF